MRAKSILILIAFAFVLASVFGGTITISDISSPSPGTYWANGTHNITFKIYADDVNGSAGQADLNVKLYYSSSAGAFENLIGDYNLINTSYCGNTNDFNVSNGVQCTIPWNMNISTDGNYYIDIEAYTHREGIPTGDKNTGSSESFYVDNTEPAITVSYPSGITCGSVTAVETTSRRITFDLNDLGAGVDINNVSVSVELLNIGARQSSFNTSLCNAFDKNYSCTYDENGMYKTGVYKITITAKDILGNSASCVFDLDFNDVVAPAQVTGVTSEAGAAQITVSWNANTESDLNGYKIYYSTQGCDFNKETGVYAGFTTQTSYVLSDLNWDKNYYIRVLAVDYSGNESTFSDCEPRKPNPAQAPAKPTLTSSTHTSDVWSNNNDVTVTWNAVENATGYSCTWSSDSSTEPDTTIDSDLSWCQNRQLSKQDLSDGIYYLKVKACTANICSDTATFIVKIDTAKPSMPSNLDASLESDGDVKLEWDASTDTGSGIKEYRIYRSTTSGFTPSNDNKVATVTETSWTDTQAEAGQTYYYKVKAVDNAGNESDAASVSIVTQSISVSIEVPNYVKAGKVEIRIKANAVLEDAYVYIQKAQENTWTKIAGPKDDDDFTVTYEFASGDDGVAKVKVVADNLTSEVVETFVVDTKAPEITWINPEPGEKISGIYTLKIETSEPSTKIAEVSFYYDNTKIAEVTQAAEKNIYWIAAWDTNKVSEGSYTLKAVAIDKAGNEGSATISVVVEKPQAKPEGKEESEESISSADSQLKDISTLLQKIKSYDAELSSATMELYSQASEFLDEAKALYNAGNYIEANEKAKAALEKLAEFTSKVSVEEVKSVTYNISVSEALKMLKDKGFSEEAINDANALLAESSARKQFKVARIKDENNISYYVKVYLTFTNTTDLNALKVIEFISKEFAENANLISSKHGFEVIEEDPTILFSLEDLKAGEKIELEYSLKEPLTQADYNEMLKKDAFKITPFAIVKPETELKVTAQPGFSGFLFTLALLLIIVVVVIAAITLFLYKFYPKKYEEEKTALMRAIERLEPKKRFSLPRIKLRKERERKTRGRWAYKGE